MSERKIGPRPASHLAGLELYAVPRAPAPTDLRLDSNEGVSPPFSLLDALPAFGPELFCRYVRAGELEARVAALVGVEPARVLAVAGGDEAIDRACRVYVQPDREVVVPSPTFEMIVSFARLSGGRIHRVPWPNGEFPLEQALAAVTPQTGMVVVISPNNPTGAPVEIAALERLSAAAPHALLLVDLAYGEFADVDVTPAALRLPNALVVKTMSKAWGMAGLRVGFALGPREIVEHLRLAGGPFPVSNLSQAAALRWLEVGRDAVAAYVGRVKRERRELVSGLAAWGASPLPSQTNFVFARARDAVWIRDAAAGLGVAIRYVPGNGSFAEGLRITCPGNERDFARLMHALRVALRPTALLAAAGSAAAAALAAHPALRERLQARVSLHEFAPPRPLSPTDVLAALSRGAEIGVASPAVAAWLLGETPEQMAAARVAGALPLAFLPPAAQTAENVARLHAAGAARVLTDLAELEVLLP